MIFSLPVRIEMSRIFIFIAAMIIALAPETQICAQKANKSTVRTASKTAKKVVARQKATGAKNAKGKVKSARGKAKAPVYTNASIRGLQNQRAAVQKKIREQERLLQANKADVKKRLNDLLVINSEIDERQKSIDGIQKDIHHIEGNITILRSQLSTLESQLEDRKAKYIKSMRYLARTHTIQDKLMFIFSAKSLTQMYRRLRFVREYAAYQRAQGELVKLKQEQITHKHKQLENVKGEKNNLLYKGKQEQVALQGKQTEQQQVVNSLQKQQKTIQIVIDDQRKKSAALNAQIDKLIAEEVAKARARAAEEVKRKAAAAAEAKRRKEAELARKKAEAEAAARENARRIQEAKEREARLKAEAALAAKEKRDAEARERAEQAARKAEADREAAERKAAVDKKRHEQAVAKAQEENKTVAAVSSEDRALGNSFASNRGRLPMPITGGYKIITHFGQYNVEGLKNVRLDSRGITIQGGGGANARAIFNGEVSKVYNVGGSWIVMVRHGNYISVYCNLRSVGVHSGQKVSTGQVLGAVGADNILQFRLYNLSSVLNPESWLRR